MSGRQASRLARLEATAPAVDAILSALDRALGYPNPGAYARACLESDPADHPWAAIVADISRRHPYRPSFRRANDDHLVAIEDALVLYKVAALIQDETDQWASVTVHAAARVRLELESPKGRSRLDRELWLEARPSWIHGAIALITQAHTREAARHEVQKRWFRSRDLLYPDTVDLCERAYLELELLEMSVAGAAERNPPSIPNVSPAQIDQEVWRLIREARAAAYRSLGSPLADSETRAMLAARV